MNAPGSTSSPTLHDAPRRARPRWRRPYVWIASGLVVALAIWWFGFRSSGAPTATTVTTTNELVTVTRGTMSDTVSAVGTVAAAQTDNLSFTSPGTVTAVNVKAGDTVTAGEVLATIDSASLQSAVTAAQSTLASAQARLSDDQASGASSAQVAADETTVTSAGDALTNAQHSLDGAQLVATFDGTVAALNLSVGEQLGSGGSGATSGSGSASGSGRSSSNLGSGSGGFGGGGSSSSTSSSPEIQVVTKGSYTVSLPVAANDIGNVADGQTVTLTVTSASANRVGGGGFGGFGGFGGGGFGGGGFGGIRSGQAATTGGSNGAGGTSGRAAGGGGGTTATGTVTNVAQVATASSGVADYPVTVSFSDTGNSVYIGATVSGAIATNVRQNVLQVPIRAVTTNNGVSTVTVATGGSANGPTEVRTVKTGATANGMVEITDGLKEGDQVVVTVLQFPTTTGTGTTGFPIGRPNGGGFGGQLGGRGATNGAGTNGG